MAAAKEIPVYLFLGQLESGKELTKCKKDIARVLTVLRQRELGISAEPVKASKKAKKA